MGSVAHGNSIKKSCQGHQLAGHRNSGDHDCRMDLNREFEPWVFGRHYGWTGKDWPLLGTRTRVAIHLLGSSGTADEFAIVLCVNFQIRVSPDPIPHSKGAREV